MAKYDVKHTGTTQHYKLTKRKSILGPIIGWTIAGFIGLGILGNMMGG